MMQEETNPRRECFGGLCRVLGSIPALKTADLNLDNDIQACTLLIESLLHVEHLAFYAKIREEDEEVDDVSEETMQAIAASLQGHTSLESIMLVLPTSCCHSILPSLQTVPNLKTIVLDGNVYEHLALRDAQAIHGLLQSELPIKLELVDFALYKEPFRQCLVDGLDGTAIRGFAMRNCEMKSSSHGVDIAKSLIRSRVKSIHVDYVPYMAPEWPGFLMTLAGSLSTMDHLRDLDIRMTAVDFARDPILDNAFLALVRAAGSCPYLEYLGLEVGSYAEPLDQALADCLCKSVTLQELEIGCPAPDVSVGAEPHACPALLKAMACNHTIQQIRFTEVAMVGSSGIDPWDADMKKNVDIIVLVLNRLGRNYLRGDDGPDKRANGVGLLGKVAETMDCLFYHLRENPCLCPST